MLGWATARCTGLKEFIRRPTIVALGVYAFCGSAWAASGLDYLASQQNPNGSFGDTPSSLATPYQSTEEVLRAYRLLGLDEAPAYAAGLNFLNNETETNTEYLVRRILANSRSGLDVSAALAELLARQDPFSGGFGNEPDASPSILDTAFALEALVQTGFASSPPARSVVSYLLSNQRTDGGWGDGDNDSAVYLTALVYRSLSGFRFSLNGVDTALSSAQSYLFTARSGDSWEESFLTALVLSAIVPSLRDLTPVTPAIDALKASQLPDGSWGGDPYTTALALQALYLVDQPRTDPTKGVVKGVIQDSATGTALAGVSITVMGAETASATSDQYGAYQISGVSAGAITLSAMSTGYVTASGTATMTAGGLIDFSPQLVKDPTPVPIAISGTVIDKTARTPIVGAVVQVVGSSVSTATGSDGHFVITGVPPGTLQLQVSAGGYLGASYSISALNGGTVDLGVIELATGQVDTSAQIVGSVVDAATGQALRNVLISVSGAVTASALSDTAGEFVLSGLTPGSVSIAASLDGYQAANASAELVAGTTINYIVRLVPIDQPAVLTITGKVVDSETSAALAGASVALPLAGISTVTAADGSFTVNGVKTGTIVVSISADGYTSVSYSANAPNGGLVALGTIALLRNATIDTNHPPVITSTAPTSIPAGQIYAYNVQAHDPDGDSLTFALGAHPNGMTITANGQVRWVPTVDQVGAQSFTVVVFDSQAGRTEQVANVTVTNGSRSYVITDVQTLSGLYVNATVPNNYVLGTYVSGANPGFVSASPACPLSWFSGGSNVAAALGSLERLSGTTALAAQPATGRDIVMDMGQPYATVTVFPEIDHGPFPQEGIEYTVWGADDPSATFPGGWHLASLVSIYRKGYVTTPSCNGQDETDDYAGLYTFGLNSYRYVRVRADFSITIFNTPAHTTWNGAGDDGGEPGWQSSEAEIDAVGGMVCDVKPQANAGGDVIGLTGQSITFDATASQGNILTYGWDLDGDGTIDLTGSTPTYVFATEFDRDVTLMVVDDRGCVGTDKTHVTIGLNLPRPDLTVNSVDTRAVVSDPQTLRITGAVGVSIQNVGRAAAVTPALVTVFEDTNRNGIYDAGADNALGSVTMPSGLARGASLSLDVPVNGAVSFRDSPLIAMVDSDRQIVEEREDNNVGRAVSACSAVPPTQALDPVLKWAWTGSAVMPEHRQVMSTPIVVPLEDTNGDGKIDQNDIPAIVFNSFAGTTYFTDGVLRAVSGRDGHELWSVTNPAYRTVGAGSLAAADLDGDGIPEIIAPKSGGGIITFDHTGAFRWSSAVPAVVAWGGPSVADIDGDGRPEIVVGNTVLNANGSLRWQGSGFQGEISSVTGPLSIVADIDLNGKAEVVAGAAAYSNTGQRLWQNNTVGDGFTAIGNFNADPYPEIVVVNRTGIFLLDHNGAVVWGPVVVPGGGGGAPVVADMDGDGVPEIGVAGAERYVVLKADGNLLWTANIQDKSSAATGSSVFDFDGDGQADVVYADEVALRVFRGRDGFVLFETPNSDGTTFDFPVIADVDADQHADIVVAGNEFLQLADGAPGPANHGIRVFQGAGNTWASTRKIWNQHSYHITNVNDNGTVPRIERNSWQAQNTYRLNALPERTAPSVADLTVAMLRAVDTDGGPARLSVRVGNAGAAGAPATSVAFYEGDPATDGVLLGSVPLAALGPNEYRDVTFDLATPLSGQREVFAVVDPADQVAECQEDNNSIAAPTKTQSTLGDITTVTDAAVYGPASPVAISATVTNISTLAAVFDASIRVEDASGAVLTTFTTHRIGPLAGGASVVVGETWNTDGYLAGVYRVRAQLLSVDGGALLDEAIVGFTIAASADDTVPAATLRVTTDRPTYNVTDRVNIDSLVANVTTNAMIDDAELRLRIKDSNGQIVFAHDGALGQLLPGALRTVLLPYSLNNAALGVYRIEGEVVNTATSAVLATSSTQYTVINDPAKNLTGDVSVGLPVVEIGTNQVCTYTVTNRGPLALDDITLRLTAVDITSDSPVETVSQAVSLASGASQSLLRTVATASLAPGDYACALEALIDGVYRPLGFAAFKVVEPPIRIDASMSIGTKGRLLVLLDGQDHDCDHGQAQEPHDSDPQKDRGHSWLAFLTGGDDPHKKGCDADRDPHGPKGAPALPAQRSFLESLLTAAGWSYTITDNVDDFGHELRTGGYSAYALFSEQAKLDDATQKELREAVFRGDGLVLAGTHDNRNDRLNDALGVKRIGTVAHANAVAIPEGPLGPMGDITLLPGDRINRIKRTSAELLATYELSGPSRAGDDDCRDEDTDPAIDIDNDDLPGAAAHSKTAHESHRDEDCDRTPDRYVDAITLNHYGFGKALFAGFDLLAQATQDGAGSRAADTLLAALTLTQPVPKAQLGGVLPVTITLENRGIATAATAQVSLPAGTQVIDAGGGQVQTAQTGQTITFTTQLAVGDERSFTFYLKLPASEASLTLETVVTAPVGNTTRNVATANLTLTVAPIATLDELLATAQALVSSVPPRTAHALWAATEDIERASRAHTLEKAIFYALKATDRLLGIDDAEVIDLRRRLDEWLRYSLMSLN